MSVQDQRDADELRHVQESGGFQRWVPYAAIGLACVVGVVGVRACLNNYNGTSIHKTDLDADSNDNAIINELRNHRSVRPTPMVVEATPTPEVPVPPPQVVAPPPSHQMTAEEEARRALRLKAFTAPQMVATFHRGDTLTIPGNRDGMQPPKTALHLNAPASPFSIMAGGIIPAVLVSGINSDNPAPVIASVMENVSDTATGSMVLIPQGTRLFGMAAGTDLRVGQSRVNIAWQRLIFPNTSSMDLPTMPGVDQTGQGGFTDQVDNHYLRTFGLAALTSVISAAQYMGSNNLLGAQGGNQFTGSYNSSANNLALQNASSGVSANMGGAANEFARRGMNTSPTITIRPGYRFDVMITTDLTFPGPYADQGVMR
jgi:type IV secretory pathway VirB10-like protein